MTFNFDSIPDELKRLPQWCGYKLELVDGEKTKVPYQVGTGSNIGVRASSTDKKTWTTFDKIKAAYQEGMFDGIAFMLSRENGIVFVDLDDCIKDGIIEPYAVDIVKKFNSYTEKSQSGKGLHILIKGIKPGDRCRSSKYPHKIELYSHSRQCCLTGDLVDTTTVVLPESRQDELDQLYNEIFGKEKEDQRTYKKFTSQGKSILSDAEILLKAEMASNGSKFKDLWNGSTLGYNGDESAADLALMNMLAFWTRCDAAQMERLFSDSRLGQRDKWRYRDDYRDRTIEAAISNCNDVYEPKKDGSSASTDAHTTTTITLESLTKAVKKVEQIDLDTGNIVLDETGSPVIVVKRTLSPSKAAQTIRNAMPLILSQQDKNDLPKIWNYDGKVWNPDGDVQIRRLVYSVLGDLAYDKAFRETLHNVRAFSNRVTFNQNPYLFPCLDGVIDLQTGEISPHSPDNFMTFTYNGHCNSKYDYDLFLWYLASTFPDIRDCLTAIDIITAVGIRVSFEVFIFLLGGGENGKGILEKLIIALYTLERGSATKLQEIKKSQFASGALLSKDFWIITEVDTVKGAMSFIKGMATGELIDSDKKYGTERVVGMPSLLPIMDANIAIDFNDQSWGRVRRTEKLDCPFEFGYKPGVRPKDPHLLEKLTTPESLAGIVQIIRARAPSLIESKKIYHRKSHDAQEAELERQQWSPQYFCNECLSTTWIYDVDPKDPRTNAPQLETDTAYASYLEYCRLFNVPVPLHKIPFGRYVCNTYGIESKQSSRINTVTAKKEGYRYYPNLYQVKCPKLAFIEFSEQFDKYGDQNPLEQVRTQIEHRSSLQNTDRTQILSKENANGKVITTDTPDKLTFLSKVFEKLQLMYDYINTCENPSKISYKDFLCHLSGVSVFSTGNDPANNGNQEHRSKKDENGSGVSVVTEASDAMKKEPSSSSTRNDPADNGKNIYHDCADKANCPKKPVLTDLESVDARHQKDKNEIESDLLDKLKTTFRVKAGGASPQTLSVSEIVYFMCFDQQWMPPDKANKLVKDAEQAGIVTVTGTGSGEQAILVSGGEHK